MSRRRLESASPPILLNPSLSRMGKSEIMSTLQAQAHI
eukprot:CAMPEP_0182573402 /NCGR_PEP_ID=MMETSP1324-20130603/20045_1 /TAXON_ID=236786 /ORGANISM="Florenciella sp., Strain RCC1587" /LENGTH=37 /DNA_ID= /DNA_START= /DNA_END= /DNA_ORIENTATION=